ncbi:MAG: division/cell wall cluster transcriptional repressor MraZ [Candidatus Pacebacteria bacterium]|nr:division/cell wall cluster transcriptional repressor MraZ [Candidatus Paceibacterota bacterium]
MFFGEYQIKFLGKGRIALPKKIRSRLSGDRVVLSRGFERCIFGWEKKTWQEASAKQTEVPVTESRGRAVRRYLFSGAMIVQFDVQGRAVIPSFLLDYAGVKKEVTVIGAGDHFEIWDTQAWQEELGSIETDKLSG